MIPTEREIKQLWDTYALPETKRIHVTWVAKLADLLASQYEVIGTPYPLRRTVLYAAAMLHDIDKAVPKLQGEQHPDAGVRVLTLAGMPEIAHIVKTHPLHAILDPAIAPKTMEEKLLYLSDKMVKQEIIGVDKRFALWEAEDLPFDAKEILRKTYPLVKQLEQEMLSPLALDVPKLALLVK